MMLFELKSILQVLGVLQILPFLVAAHGQNVDQAAKVARRIVNKGSTLHFNSLNPDGTPVSMIEYYISSDQAADVHGFANNGNPILLLSRMSTSYKNWHLNGTVSLTIEKKSWGIFDREMENPRETLFGKLRKLDLDPADEEKLASHFVKRHPDARHWLPDKEDSHVHVHDTLWVEFNVEKLYFVGGFGDRSFIGNITGDKYHRKIGHCGISPSHGVKDPKNHVGKINDLEDGNGQTLLSEQPFFKSLSKLIKTVVTTY